MKDPERYGVIELDGDGTPVGIEEKPGQPAFQSRGNGALFL